MSDQDILDSLARLVGELGPALEPAGYDELLEEIAGSARAQLSAAACSIAVLDLREEVLVFLAASGEGAERVKGTTMPAGSGIAGWVVASGQSITVSDTAKDPRFAADVAASTGYVPNSLLAIPLQAGDDVLGVMEILDAREGDDLQQTNVGLLARQAALALQSIRLFQELGTALLGAVGKNPSAGDLGEALSAAAEQARGARRELDELAWNFYELGRLGPDERAAAIRLLSAFTTYARGAAPQP